MTTNIKIIDMGKTVKTNPVPTCKCGKPRLQPPSIRSSDKICYCGNCGDMLTTYHILNEKTETKDDIIMETYDVKEVFDRYIETPELREADIFHLYDTGEECLKDNSGYHDSRHFELLAFNTKTMQKKNCGRHDGITSYSKDLPVEMLRVYADGSFFVKLGRLAKIELFQNVKLI